MYKLLNLQKSDLNIGKSYSGAASIVIKSLQGSVFINDQHVIIIDFVSISTMTYIYLWIPTIIRFTHNISIGFQTEEVLQKKTTLRQITIIF